MAYTFNDTQAPTRKRVQYYEVYGHRGLWRDGWKVVSDHLVGTQTGDFVHDQWELYHTDAERNELTDLADQFPDKTQELVEQWWVEAGRYNVLPLDDRYYGRASSAPTPRDGRRSFRYYPVGGDVPEQVAVNVRNRSHRITAHARGSLTGEGILLAQGGRFGGYVLFITNGRLRYVYNYLGRELVLQSDVMVPEGCARAGVQFTSTGTHMGVATLFMDDSDVGHLDVPSTVPYRFDHDGALRAGRDTSMGVSKSYRAPFPFSGDLKFVDVDVDDMEWRDPETELRNQMFQQ